MILKIIDYNREAQLERESVAGVCSNLPSYEV